jgi:hypothetical protein
MSCADRAFQPLLPHSMIIGSTMILCDYPSVRFEAIEDLVISTTQNGWWDDSFSLSPDNSNATLNRV